MADQPTVPSATDRVVVRRLLSSSRTTWLSLGAVVVGAVGVSAWGLATQTGANRAIAGVIGVVTIVLLLAAAWRRTWVDLDEGVLGQSVLGITTRRVPWAEASTVDLERNHGGQLALRVVGGRTIRITVLAVDLGGDRSMDPDQLRLLADQLSRWAPHRERVAAALRTQADFVEQGGAPRESPLARRL